MLKADNGKAFDTLGWQFIFGAMKEINIPNGIARLIQFCMSSSRVTILVNGSGSGFIKPTRGLRQGNPLSPYLFIIAIEFLTKRINVAIQRGMLKGIKLAKQAPVLSHALYADDLVILGQASGTEVMDLEAIFDAFAQASGLQINPEKSSMWFSSDCTEDEKGAIMQHLGQNWQRIMNDTWECLYPHNSSQRDLTHDLLVQKFHSRLAGWKINLLSHTGRLALIKSVLMTISVYYMSLNKIPTQ